jgi:hypothetical protein
LLLQAAVVLVVLVPLLGGGIGLVGDGYCCCSTVVLVVLVLLLVGGIGLVGDRVLLL